MRAIRFFSAAAAIIVFPGLALAHPGHAGPADFGSGLLHPFGGADHVLAMVAVGLAAGRAGGRALVAVPAAFVGGMLAGLAAGLWTSSAGFVEIAVAATVLLLGLALLADRSLSWCPMVCAAALFGLAHGHVHASEAPAMGDIQAWAAGILSATAALHAAGVFLGSALNGGRLAWARRAAGSAIAAYGAVLVLAAT